jgi:hypothetical protein
MTLSEKRKRRAKLRNRREKLEDHAIEKAHELDVLERRRQELKKRDPQTEENIEKVKELLADNHAEIAFVREREDELESAISKLTRRIKKLSREIRSAIKPPIRDLGMGGSSCTPMPAIKACVGHYTAGPLARTDEEAVRMWWQVRAQHMSQGWNTIGYHIGLGPEGGIYLLRPRNCVGAHTLGFNTGYIGFSVHGTLGDNWTKAQLRAYRYAIKKFGYSNLRVYGHNDLNSTSCPGSFKAKYVSKGR